MANCGKCTAKLRLAVFTKKRAAGEAGTYHAKGPENSIVNQQPSLLAEPGDVLSLGYSPGFGKRCENVFHSRRPQSGEEDNEEQD